MILGCLLTSLYFLFFISKSALLCPGDLEGLFDQLRLFRESFEKYPCGHVGGIVTNDPLIRREPSLTFRLSSRHSLFLQPDEGCGFITITCFLI